MPRSYHISTESWLKRRSRRTERKGKRTEWTRDNERTIGVEAAFVCNCAGTGRHGTWRPRRQWNEAKEKNANEHGRFDSKNNTVSFYSCALHSVHNFCCFWNRVRWALLTHSRLDWVLNASRDCLVLFTIFAQAVKHVESKSVTHPNGWFQSLVSRLNCWHNNGTNVQLKPNSSNNGPLFGRHTIPAIIQFRSIQHSIAINCSLQISLVTHIEL